MRQIPLPEGYRFWLMPSYRLETPVVCVKLPLLMGKLLAFLITNRGRRLSAPEIFRAIHLGYESGGPLTGPAIISFEIIILKQRLEAAGVTITVKSGKGFEGYTFLGFGTCAPVVGRYVKGTRRYRQKRAADLPKATPVTRKAHRSRKTPAVSDRKNLGRPKQPAAPPKTGGKVYCENVPWEVPPRVEKYMRGRAEEGGPSFKLRRRTMKTFSEANDDR